MKFLDIINESEEERLLKRGKTIFKAYKEGTITRTDGVSFSYVLDNNVEMMVRNGELELYGSVSKIIENTYCPINERYMTELMENRFRKFYITTDLRPPSKNNIHKFQGKKPWELSEEDIDRTYLKKMKKKGELIYKLYKKGKLIADREDGKIHYTYELSDGKLINAVPGDIFLSPDNIKIKYHNELTNKFALLPILNYIKKKFHNHGITLRIPRPTEIYIDEWKEPINESNEDKLIRKGKLIFKALRKGTIGSMDEPNKPMFTYELSNDMSVNTTYGDIIIFTDEIKVVELNEPCVRMSTDLMANKIRNRFKQFKVQLHHPPIHSLNVDCYYDRHKKEGLNENLVHKITDEDRKKVKLVHRAIRSGVVNVNDVRYRYELPENYEISPANNKIIRIRFEFYRGDLRGNNRGEKLPLKLWRIEDDKDVYINGLLDNADVSDICYGEHYHQKETTQEYMKIKNVVRRRYNNFNIALDVSPIERPLKTININLPINEQDDVVITDDYTYPTKEQKKRARIIYRAFKTGKFTVEDGGGTYKYVLPDEYYVSVSGDGELNIVLTMNPQQKMKMYHVTKKYDGTTVELDVDIKERTYLYRWMMGNIENKFKQFQINFIF